MFAFMEGWSPDLQAAAIGAIVGGVLGILGAILGGVIGGWVTYRYELKRAAKEKREKWIELALEWASNGRKDSLRRTNLRGADLSGACQSVHPRALGALCV